MKNLNTLLAQFWIGAVKSLVHVPLSVRCEMAKGLGDPQAPPRDDDESRALFS